MRLVQKPKGAAFATPLLPVLPAFVPLCWHGSGLAPRSIWLRGSRPGAAFLGVSWVPWSAAAMAGFYRLRAGARKPCFAGLPAPFSGPQDRLEVSKAKLARGIACDRRFGRCRRVRLAGFVPRVRVLYRPTFRALRLAHIPGLAPRCRELVSVPCLLPRVVRGGASTVPCGKCRECLRRYRDEETQRCLWEVDAAQAAWFFTGTFEGEAPDRKSAQAAWNAFRMRLARRFPGVEFRYLRVPEFGSRNGRFHWHAIMLASYGPDVSCPRVDDLDDAWRQGRKSEGFAKVKVLKGPHKDTSPGQVLKSVKYVVKYLRKGAGKAPAGKSAPNVSRSEHLGSLGVERVVAAIPTAQAILDAFPGAQVTGAYVRVDAEGEGVSPQEAALGRDGERRRVRWVPGVMDPFKARGFTRLKPEEVASGLDPEDVAEVERLRRSQYGDPRDDPNRLVNGGRSRSGLRALTVGQAVQSTKFGDLSAARSARLSAKRQSWWSSDASAAARAANEARFAADLASDPGLAHVHRLDPEDEESNHWFGDPE